MLGQLLERERNLSELASPLDMSFAAASKHVRVLEAAGLVHRTVVGREHICRIEGDPLESANAWLERCRRAWEDNFTRLDVLLKEMASPAASSKGHEHRVSKQAPKQAREVNTGRRKNQVKKTKGDRR